MSARVYLNGQLVELNHAAVPASNPALLHGVGLFETLRAYDGVPFLLDRHLERLRASASRFDMQVEQAVAQVPSAVSQVLEANQLRDARIRFTVTPPSPQATTAGPTLLIAAEQMQGYPPELYERGMSVWICTSSRQSAFDPLAGHKTTSYLPRLLALRDAQNHQCGEALWFTPDNMLAEGSISNIFLVKAGKLRTPPLDTPILPGITRKLVLELAHQQNTAVEEAPCTIHDLLDADEVFLTNSVMEIMPVTRVERRAIASEKPGAITLALQEAYTLYRTNYAPGIDQ